MATTVLRNGNDRLRKGNKPRRCDDNLHFAEEHSLTSGRFDQTWFLIVFKTFRSILTFPWVELGGKVHITCAKTGYNASVTFHTKPFYGGKLHRVTGEVKNASSGRVICKINGEWNSKLEISFTSNQVSSKYHYLTIRL